MRRNPALWAAVGSFVLTSPVLAQVQTQGIDPPPMYSVSVTPDGATASAVSPYETGDTLTFHVVNTGGSSDTYEFSCGPATTVSCTDISPSSASLAPSASTDVTVTYDPTLESGTQVLSLVALGLSNDDGSYDIPLSDPHTAPLVDVTPHNGENLDVARCVLDCLDATLSYSTPAYFSRDQARSVTLLYRSGQAAPRPMVIVDATDTSSTPAQMFSVQLRRKWDNALQSLRGGLDEVYFTRSTSGTNRLAAQFDATSGFPSGAYSFDLIIRSYWSSSDPARERVVPVTVLVVNETDSRFGWGWSMPGLQAVQIGTHGVDGVTITEGDGSILSFTGSCAYGPAYCTFESPPGDFSTLVHDNFEFERSWPNGTTVTFDEDGLQTSAEDRFGNQTTYHWTGTKLDSIVDPVGKATTLAYGSDGKIAWIETPDGRRSTLSIDSYTRVVSITDPTGGTPIVGIGYDGSKRVTSYNDIRGNTWSFTYDVASKLATATAPPVDLDGVPGYNPVTTFVAGERRLWQSNSATYGIFSNPRGARTASHWRYEVTSPEGLTTRHYLDRWRQPLHSLVAPGTALVRESYYAYNDDGLLVLSRDALGNAVANTWDGHLLTQVYDSARSRVVNTSYDPVRYYAVSQVSGTGIPTTTYSLYSNGLPHTATTGSSPFSLFSYDSIGRMLTATDPDGHTTTRTYQSGGFQNTLSVRSATGDSVIYLYDAAGRRTGVINPLGDTVTTVFDDLNRVVDVTDPLGNTTHHGYADVAGQDTVVDAAGNVYVHQYDALGRLEWEAPPGGGYLSYGYDLDGRLTKTTNRRGQDVVMTYDDLGRMLTRTADGATTNRAYFGIADSAAAWNYADSVTTYFDALGQTDSITFVRGGDTHRLVYAHNLLEGKLDSVVFRTDAGVTRTTTYSWDPTFHDLENIDGSSEFEPTYDDDRLPTSLFMGTVETRRRYTTGHLLAEGNFYEFGQSSATLNEAFGRRYQRDPLGRIAARFGSLDGVANGTEFTYDAAGRLDTARIDVTCPSSGNFGWDSGSGYTCNSPGYSSSTTLDYDWDEVGNPTTGSAVVNSANRLTSMDGYTFEYDADGNETRKYGNGLDRRYHWNTLGQLVAVATVGGDSVTYAYGPGGGRVRKTVGSTVTEYIYDRGNLAAELDGSGSILRSYKYQSGMDSPIKVQFATGAAYWYIREAANNVIGLMTDVGDVAQTYSYYPFGAYRDSTGAVDQPLRFGSREWDDASGLYYNRARWYDPDVDTTRHVGRFISEDPIRLAGGANLYAYAGDDPVNGVDPTGLMMDYSWMTGPGPGRYSGYMESFDWDAAVDYMIDMSEEWVGGGGKPRIVSNDVAANGNTATITTKYAALTQDEVDYLLQHEFKTTRSLDVLTGAGVAAAAAKFLRPTPAALVTIYVGLALAQGDMTYIPRVGDQVTIVVSSGAYSSTATITHTVIRADGSTITGNGYLWGP